jgi:hypothetical protein
MRNLLLLIILCFAAGLIAHPASNVTLTFDSETKILDVNFDHKVSDAEKHFIFEIKVYLNKDVIIEQELFSQDGTESGSLVYKINDAKIGDKIKVTTNCNKTGKKSDEITVE